MKTQRLRADLAGERLDAFIARRCPDLSRAYARRLVEEGHVTLAGRTVRPSHRLQEGVDVEVEVPAPVSSTLMPDHLPLDILHEDADVLVINKPPGMAVHPSAGHERATLVNVLLSHYPDIGPLQGELRPGIVHRLDKDTSGAIMIARTAAAQVGLTAQIKDRTVEKVYLAIVEGQVTPSKGVVDAPIGRDPRHRQRQAIVEGGREALTHYRVVAQAADAALLEVRLETGRTHQIRVHLGAIGFPVMGDRVYGRASEVIGRQALHAWRLGFRHPSTGEAISVTAEPPADFVAALAALGLGQV